MYLQTMTGQMVMRFDWFPTQGEECLDALDTVSCRLHVTKVGMLERRSVEGVSLKK